MNHTHLGLSRGPANAGPLPFIFKKRVEQE